jgi:hypothetical protein
MVDQDNQENIPQESLTCIGGAYTIAGTPESKEVNELMIRNFLNTLAEVALSIASREVNSQ